MILDTLIFLSDTLIPVALRGSAANVHIFKKTERLDFQPFRHFLGTPSGVRTLDTLIKSQVLCQLS